METKIDGRSLRTDYVNSGVRQRQRTHCPAGHPYDEANTSYQAKKSGKVSRICKTCQRERMQRKRLNPEFAQMGRAAAARWRKAHPEEYRAQWEKAHAEKKQILDDARASGCILCGEKHPACLDFHHRNGLSDKLGNISETRRFSIAKIRAEIAKCDVLCANCHRKHHYEERHKEKE